MEQELIDPSANDPASKAFDRLRREVTTMRLAVEHLADAPGKIEIPDYTETLTQIEVRITATHKALRTPVWDMTRALDRAVFRRVATSHTGTKGLHHGTHINRSNHRTQDARLPSMARHQQRR